MYEEWRPVIGYEKEYAVSSLGRVKRLAGVVNSWCGGRRVRERVLATDRDRSGYVRVCLCKGGEQRHGLVAVLVAQAFLGPRPAGFQVNHLDGQKENNRASNLEYVTPSQNLHHAARVCGKRGRRGSELHWWVKLRAEDIPTIRAARAVGERAEAVAARYGVTKWTIYAACAGRSWKHIPTITDRQ